MDEIETKPKRVHRNPRKKWTVLEEKRLIEFLMENREFEKPTAQSYYRRFAQEKNIRVEWKLVRSKVRNMRTVYAKAKTWKESPSAVLGLENEAVKSTLLKMCNFYYAFENIFENAFIDSVVKEEGFQSPECQIFDSTEYDEGDITMTSECSTAENDGVARPGHSVTYFRSTVSDIMQIQAETLKLKRQKMDMDLVLRERELKIKERELELKEREICSQEKLKILELEMKERLAMEELNRKYK